MKTQQRTFVVEIKSARRRSPSPDSIWGNTDLKALVRRAEADAPHLFECDTVPEAFHQDGEAPAAPEHQTPPNDDSGADTRGDVTHPLASAEKTCPIDPAGDTDASSFSVSQSKTGTSEPRPRTISKQRRQKGVEHHLSRAEVHEARSTGPEVETSSEELDMLEAENRRLRGLLAQHLHQEKSELLNMLQRIGAI